MPIYEYFCKKCETKMEIICKMSEGENQKCPSCKKKLQRLLSTGVEGVFANPKESSKWEKFTYRAGALQEKAQIEMADARAKTKYNPYKRLKGYK